LIEAPLDPPSWFPDTIEEWRSGQWRSKSDCVIEEVTFLIGNHADELTVSFPTASEQRIDS
jgi:tRNASer (uridine44-2'-O)-methyltransferase